MIRNANSGRKFDQLRKTFVLWFKINVIKWPFLINKSGIPAKRSTNIKQNLDIKLKNGPFSTQKSANLKQKNQTILVKIFCGFLNRKWSIFQINDQILSDIGWLFGRKWLIYVSEMIILPNYCTNFSLNWSNFPQELAYSF